jgi:hypothetical protein
MQKMSIVEFLVRRMGSLCLLKACNAIQKFAATADSRMSGFGAGHPESFSCPQQRGGAGICRASTPHFFIAHALPRHMRFWANVLYAFTMTRCAAGRSPIR